MIGQLTFSDWRTQVLGGYFRKWVTLGLLIGVVAGIGAIVFAWTIDQATELLLGRLAGAQVPAPAGEGALVDPSIERRWALPLVVGLGGLLSGIAVFWLAPEAEGHGTDAAIDAFHHKGGVIRRRIPPVKLLASAITIGSGGSAGREGPTAQIAAGFGSWLGDAFRLNAHDRRIALAVGMGAGIGAIFKAPLGGAILAAEILYIRDFELDAIVPGFIASVTGYAIFGSWSGWTPVFGSAHGLTFSQPASLGWYALLGLAAGAAGIAYVRVFYGTRDMFRRLAMPRHLKPMVAGALAGLIGIAYPQVLSMGYGWLQFGIDGNTAELATTTMLILVALKIVATSLTIGSGGSGGVFAPGLFIGGMLGGGVWGLMDGRLPYVPETPAPFIIVGMMALFGGVANAPIAVMLMVAEMTGDFSMLVPAMVATSIAYLTTGPASIYENQVPTRADSPAHRAEYTIPLISTVRVGDAMRRNVVTTAPDERISAAEERMAENDVRGMPVVSEGALTGMFTATDALRGHRDGKEYVGEVMAPRVLVAHPDESLHSALRRMTANQVSRLPVVQRDAPKRVIGIVSVRDVAVALEAELRALADERAASGRGHREREMVRLNAQ